MTIENDSMLIFMEAKGKMQISLTSAVKHVFHSKKPSPLAEDFIFHSMTTIMSSKNVYFSPLSVSNRRHQNSADKTMLQMKE